MKRNTHAVVAASVLDEAHQNWSARYAHRIVSGAKKCHQPVVFRVVGMDHELKRQRRLFTRLWPETSRVHNVSGGESSLILRAVENKSKTRQSTQKLPYMHESSEPQVIMCSAADRAEPLLRRDGGIWPIHVSHRLPVLCLEIEPNTPPHAQTKKLASRLYIALSENVLKLFTPAHHVRIGSSLR